MYLDIERGHDCVVELQPLAAATPRADVAIVMPGVGSTHVHNHSRKVVVVVVLWLALLRLVLVAFALDVNVEY